MKKNDDSFNINIAKRLIEAEAQIERHRSLAQMVAGVAHEINTPLDIVNTAANIIANRISSTEMQNLFVNQKQSHTLLEDIQEATELLQKNIKRAYKLVESFKKISTHQLTDVLETINLPESVAEAVDLFKLNARSADLNIEIIHEPESDSKEWTGYRGYLTQVIMNLLTNVERYAYPANKGGKVEINISNSSINEKPAYTISVRDFGQGISPKDLSRIYEPFFTTGRATGGTGLGMAIVYKLVNEALQGQIELESEPGKGTAAFITIPKIIVI